MIQPPNMHLAEVNIGRTRGAIDDPVMAEFKARLDAVNALAERSPGFVWRLTGDGDDATDVRIADDPMMAINLSVWETPAQLADFVWKTVHAKVYARKAEWFEAMSSAHFVMWWVPVGHEPSAEEALERLAHYNEHGPSEHAFGWAELPEVKLWMEKRCA